jgi:acyl-CoA thioesterase-1
LEQNWGRYASGALMIQALGLAGCDGSAPEPASTANTTAAAPTPLEPAPVAGPEQLVLAFGDSLYAGYGLNRGQSLPDALQDRLRAAGINARFVNAGVSGDTTAAGRRRLAFALDNLHRKPDLVILGLGGNDLLRQISPSETRANLTAMLDELKRRDVPVLLTGMLAPPNLGPEYRKTFDTIWPDLAKRYDTGLYPFILNGVIGNPQLMQRDRVHPTARGVARIADQLAPLAIAELTDGEK